MTTHQYDKLVYDLLNACNKDDMELYYIHIKNALILFNTVSKKKSAMDFIQSAQDSIYLKVSEYDSDEINKISKLLNVFKVVHTMKLFIRKKFKNAWNYELTIMIPDSLYPKDFNFDKIPYLTPEEKTFLEYEFNEFLNTLVNTSIQERIKKDFLEYYYIQTVKILFELYEENVLHDGK